MAPSVLPSTVTSPKSANMGGLKSARFAGSREATPVAGKPTAPNGETEVSLSRLQKLRDDLKEDV